VYIFSKNRRFRSGLIRDTVSGGVCLNDLVIQFVHSWMPFGGIGKSGIGRLHGYAGFREFSNQRMILSGNTLNALKLIYPPITPFKQKLIDILFKYW
jgi:aldehyde dehydrogenase (NAD+)